MLKFLSGCENWEGPGLPWPPACLYITRYLTNFILYGLANSFQDVLGDVAAQWFHNGLAFGGDHCVLDDGAHFLGRGRGVANLVLDSPALGLGLGGALRVAGGGVTLSLQLLGTNSVFDYPATPPGSHSSGCQIPDVQ